MTKETLPQGDEATDRSEQAGPIGSGYEAPRLVHLGKSKQLIRGYWGQGTADHGTNWYITGE